MERNIRLDIAYDGTNYAGWQIQENATTVESTLREALERLRVSYRGLVASGRTDSGVHARGQTLSFHTDSSIPDTSFREALNSVLPPDIAVLASSRVADDFHARYSALGKHYSYHIDLSPVPSPFTYRYSWHYPYALERQKLEDYAEFLTGAHDFGAFRKTGSSVKTTEREIYAIRPHYEGEEVVIDYIGNGFLYNMVRIMTGTMVQYAAGQVDDRVYTVFDEPVRENAGITAPPQGLFLEGVFYSADELKKRVEAIG